MSENENHRPLKFSAPSKSVAAQEKPPPLVYLPGFEGTPVRGSPQRILAPEELRTYKQHWDVHLRIFDLTVPDQTEAYERLMTAAASNSWVTVFKEIMPENIDDKGNCKIGVKWGERFLQPQDSGVFVMTDDTVGA